MNRNGSERQTFLLPIQTLLDLLRDQKETGYLQTNLSSLQIKGKTLKGVFSVEIAILAGRPQSCTIRAKDGSVFLQDRDAWNAIPPREAKWTLVLTRVFQASPSPTQEFSPKSPSMPVPKSPSMQLQALRSVPSRRILNPTPEQTAQWTRQHIRVFALVDGRKTISQIAVILRLSPQEVEKLLHDLERIAFIYFN